MNSTEARDSLRRQLAEHGRTITVRRYAGTGPARVPVAPEATTLARVTGYGPKDLVGAVVQGDRRVIALVESGSLLAGLLPLTKADRLVVGGVEIAIEACDQDTRCLQGDVFGLDIHARG